MQQNQDAWIKAMVELLMPSLGAGVPGQEAKNSPVISLDQIGEVIGGQAVDAADIERLIQTLEAKGATIADAEGQQLIPLLKSVIQTALALRKEGKTPSPLLISERSGLSARAVRVALLYADVLKG